MKKIFFVILVLFSAGCRNTEEYTVAPPPPEAPAPLPQPASPAPEWMASGATNRVADIIGNPKAFIGKTVTVVAKVDDIYSPRAFTLEIENRDSSGKGSSKDELLVLVPKVGGFPNVDAQWEDDKARVTGVVQLMGKYLEREIGWELPPRLESSYRGKPALIVRSLERLAR